MSTITVAAVASPSKKDKLLEDNCNADMDDFTTSSIFEFLNKERDCYNNADDDGSELDVESLFEEINRLSDNTDDRSIDEIIREAEMLLADPQPHMTEHEPNVMNNKNSSVRGRASGVVSGAVEPAPACAVKCDSPGADDGEVKKTDERGIDEKQTREASRAALKQHIAAMPLAIVPDRTETGFKKVVDAVCPDSVISEESTPKGMRSDDDDSPTLDISDSIGVISLQIDEPPSALVLDASRTFTSPINRNRQPSRRNSFEPTPRSFTPCSASSSPQLRQNAKIIDRSRSIPIEKSFCDRSTNPSPTHAVANATTSPIQNNISISREYALKHEIDVLQEKLKDTEERLQSLRIQHDSLSTIHRDLRESHARLQEESELLKLDVQHLNECANILRNELQSARNDRNEALDVQKLLQTELDESRGEKKKAQEQCDKDARAIQDLQRQCREMERILMRKHPDSVSALIVASKNPAKNNDNSASRRLLEQRIAQLESDAKDQDHKAQKILANVQARFNSVQSKYETHIADLETQVLSLQEINTKLNEKIETEIRLLNNPCKDENGYISNSTQTDNLPEKDPNTTVTRTSSTQTDTSRPNSSTLTKIPSNRKLQMNKMSVSHSDTTISGNHAAAKEDAHLLATLRGMRIDLALKDKATQRLTRELEECKKTIKKLQREKEVMKSEKPSSASSSSSISRKLYDPNQFTEHSADGQALKEALNKIKLLQNDYKALHDKRLQDLKTLQSAHEREMASSQESVRALQQRLSERDEAFATQKRRKVPIDYYALKAKVSSLERRHSEREERLHMLVEALSKGRINGALDEILTENDQ